METEAEPDAVPGPRTDPPPGAEPDPAPPREWVTLTAVLVGISLLTSLYLGLTGDLVPAVGAAVLALGFGTFLAGSAGGSRFSLEAVARSWDEHRWYVGFAAGTFGFGIAIGVLLYAAGINLLELFIEIISAELGEEFADEAENNGEQVELELSATFFIVQNTPPYLLTVIGAVTFGILTMVILVGNGVIVGNVGIAVSNVIGVGEVFALLVPHGIFELPAIFLAAGVGFCLVHRLVGRIRGSRQSFVTRQYVRQTLLFLLYGWLILVLAAFIEAYLTTVFAELLFGDIEVPEGADDFDI